MLAQKQDTGRSKVEFIPFLTELRVATVLDEVIEIMARVRMDFALAVVISHFSWGRQSSRVLRCSTAGVVCWIEPEAAGLPWTDSVQGHFCGTAEQRVVLLKTTSKARVMLLESQLQTTVLLHQRLFSLGTCCF